MGKNWISPKGWISQGHIIGNFITAEKQSHSKNQNLRTMFSDQMTNNHLLIFAHAAKWDTTFYIALFASVFLFFLLLSCYWMLKYGGKLDFDFSLKNYFLKSLIGELEERPDA